MEHMDVDD
jgi:hypothetical protein